MMQKLLLITMLRKFSEAVATSISVQNIGASDYNFTVKGVRQ